MADKKLVLHPGNPWAILQDPYELLDHLRALGLIAGSFPHMGELHYHAGPRFTELISFHPPAPGAPPSEPSACHVTLVETTSEPTFLGGSNVQPPACAHCGTRFDAWAAHLKAWQQKQRSYLWPCRSCGRSLHVEELNWHQTSGVARYSVDVWGIGQGEAEPAPALMSWLEQETGESWRSFFYRF
jgi:hypothetical protein